MVVVEGGRDIDRELVGAGSGRGERKEMAKIGMENLKKKLRTSISNLNAVS